MASLPKAPLDDVRSHSTFRRCSLQFKRGSTIIGGIPFDIKCLAFVTLSSTFQLSGNGRKSHSFFSSLLSPTYFLSLPSSLFSSFSLVFSFLLLFFLFFFIKHHVAKERGLRGGSSRRGQRHVLRECFSLHTVYTEQCGPDNWIRVPARVRDNIRINENVHAPMYVRIWRWTPVTRQRPGHALLIT